MLDRRRGGGCVANFVVVVVVAPVDTVTVDGRKLIVANHNFWHSFLTFNSTVSIRNSE